jgi:hypothetical protein
MTATHDPIENHPLRALTSDGLARLLPHPEYIDMPLGSASRLPGQGLKDEFHRDGAQQVTGAIQRHPLAL